MHTSKSKEAAIKMSLAEEKEAVKMIAKCSIVGLLLKLAVIILYYHKLYTILHFAILLIFGTYKCHK